MDYERQAEKTRTQIPLTQEWGEWESVSLYLDRCQVDTPDSLVQATWAHVGQLRNGIGKVADFGAGDGRFARHGQYREYVGYEIDPLRSLGPNLPQRATLIHQCAFSQDVRDADLCIGNPPFVRNQDLPKGWRVTASKVLKRRTGVAISGLANAWQYFFLLSLASAKRDGLCALVIPYEWVSRPSCRALRDYIFRKRWNVAVYRLVDATFDSVMTTASITIVDKASRDQIWRYFEETAAGIYCELPSQIQSAKGVIQYLKRSEIGRKAPRAVRGLSPGTQKVLTLTEGERIHAGLKIDRDVVPCVTTLRDVPANAVILGKRAFRKHFVQARRKCWLIRTDKKPTKRLQAYLEKVPPVDYQTNTCLEREVWWKFTMPLKPKVLMAQGFKGNFPKAVKNLIGARAVGGVCGIYNVNKSQVKKFTEGLDGMNLRNRVVAHSHDFRKIEINQLNSVLGTAFGRKSGVK